MTTPTPVHAMPDLKVVHAFAQLLERIERRPGAVTPEQYRSVVQRLAQALDGLPHDARLEAVLGAFPATAELYENLNYAHAGLCRMPLELSLNSELQARQTIERAQQRPAGTDRR